MGSKSDNHPTNLSKQYSFSWKFQYRPLTKSVLLFTLGIFFVFLFYNILVKPSNSRNWENGFEVLPKITIDKNQVSVQNLRDYHYDTDQILSTNYVNKSYDAEKIKKVWFVLEPFAIKPFTNFKGVAHTYFVFDFHDQDPVVVSVEARREKGEKYDAWLGMLNRFELIYVWGSEMDETARRVVLEDNKLFMLPLTISNSSAKQLFLQLAQTSHQLESNPRFYNTLSSNCTNELAKNANKVKLGSIPFNKALFLPGYSLEVLYDLGYIPNDQPLSQIVQKYYVSDLVQKYYKDPNFSQKLREEID